MRMTNMIKKRKGEHLNILNHFLSEKSLKSLLRYDNSFYGKSEDKNIEIKRSYRNNCPTQNITIIKTKNSSQKLSFIGKKELNSKTNNNNFYVELLKLKVYLINAHQLPFPRPFFLNIFQIN